MIQVRATVIISDFGQYRGTQRQNGRRWRSQECTREQQNRNRHSSPGQLFIVEYQRCPVKPQEGSSTIAQEGDAELGRSGRIDLKLSIC
jgi:hypothetical protein